MPVTRAELERRETEWLAPYAQRSGETRGRVHPEGPPVWRTEYSRDRDRVIHSRAFRRLEYKTQVFLNGTGDHLRTRLTHTIEVTAIARNISRALQLNEELTETIALAHDLGHAPFGHTGEHALNRLMRGYGGFEHNRQSLRIVEELEQKYPKFPGLNLTWEVREGLAKHAKAFPALPSGEQLGFEHHQPSLEAQVANLADSIAYYSHDLDDGLGCGLLEEKRLAREVELWAVAARKVRRRYGKLPDECRQSYTIRTLIDEQVSDVVRTTEERILSKDVGSADAVRACKIPLASHSAERRRQNLQLRRYLYRNLYYNPEVHRPNRRAVRMLEALFRHLLEHPEDAGGGARRRAGKAGRENWPRALCDYLSGMTDRYCMSEYARLLGREE